MPRRSELNAGSTVIRSGSGYVTGGAPGEKSRGGFEITEGGLLRAGRPLAQPEPERGVVRRRPVPQPRHLQGSSRRVIRRARVCYRLIAEADLCEDLRAGPRSGSRRRSGGTIREKWPAALSIDRTGRLAAVLTRIDSHVECPQAGVPDRPL